MSDIESERPLTRREASDYLTRLGYKVASSTLAKYATIGGGPVYELFGRHPRYRPPNLRAWIAARSSGPRRSTSDHPKFKKQPGGAT